MGMFLDHDELIHLTGRVRKDAHEREKQAEQEPVACKHEWFRTGAMEIWESRCIHCGKWNHAAPVRTKDLTNSEKLYILGSHIDPITKDVMGLSLIDAAIAADREKNRG